MMSLRSDLLLSALVAGTCTCPAQGLQWAKALGGPGSTYAQAIALDGDGNVYTTGWFSGTADFDPGPGTFNLTVGVGGNTDIFVSKLDATGQFIWAKRLGGNGYDHARAIAVDDQGHVHVAGDFQGTADFDPGPDTFALTSSPGGQNDVFVCKLDAMGDFVWARRMGGTSSERGFGVAVNGAGDVYTVGNFSGTADFDPGSGQFNLIGAGPDIFVSKLDALGDFVWAKQMGGPGDDAAQAITLDAGGDLLLTGYFRGAADFDPGPGTYVLTAAGGLGESDAFVCRLDPTGALVWAAGMGGEGRDIGYAIALDGPGNVHTTGSFTGTADLDPGPGVHDLVSASAIDRNIYVSKLDANGGFQWAALIGGTNAGDGLGIAVDANGSVYTTGFFNGTFDMDPGPGDQLLTAAGIADAYISNLDADGLFGWAAQLSGAGQLGGSALAVEANGTCYATGFFFGTADLDPGPGTVNLTAPPNTALTYVVRLADPSTGTISEQRPTDALIVRQDAFDGRLTVHGTSAMEELVLFDALGRVVHRASPNSTLHLMEVRNTGLHILRATMGGRSLSHRIVVVH